MDQYDHDTFDGIETLPTIEEIERRLRRLGCTKEQVRRHVDQLAVSRTQGPKEKRRKPSAKGFDGFEA
jgi:hypothetical protein